MRKARVHEAPPPPVKFSWKQKLPCIYARFDTRLGHYKADVVTEVDFLLPLFDQLSLILHMTEQGKTPGTRRRRFAEKWNGLLICHI